MPRISVIMSIYKEHIEWMKQAIDSILSQTYSDFEFIIVNDCPERKDNEFVLNEYKQIDPRIIILKNEKNLGLTKSLNRALNIANGDYIARMDADDISLPKRFEKQIAYLDSHPEVCGIGSWTISINEDGKRIGIIKKYETNQNWTRAQFIQNSQVAHPASMFRRKLKDYIVRYDESVRFAQDYSLWISILPFGEVTNIPEPLFCYRVNGQQITSVKKEEQQKCAGIAQRKAFSLFGFPLIDSFLKMFYSMTIQHCMDLPKDKVKKTFCNFFKEVKATKENSLALEVIYSTYIAYLLNQTKGSKINFISVIISNSSLYMLFIGCKLIYHLLAKKIK